MWPVLFKVGTFEVRSFSLLVLIAYGVALWMAARRAQRYGLEPGKVADVGLWLLLGGIIGARLGFIVQELGYFLSNPRELLTFRFEGLTSFGAIVGGVIVAIIWCRATKYRLARFLDLFALPMLIAHAIGRVGCLLNGCCYGGPTDLPWGVHFEHKNEMLFHPAQIYDSLMVLVGALAVWFVEKRPLRRTQSFWASVVVYGLSRYIYEFWRAGTTSTYWNKLPITQAQAAAALMVILGVVFFVYAGRRSAAV
jgi:phosphatidylglycerol:prolipoprotein diacylglycerol transferase